MQVKGILGTNDSQNPEKDPLRAEDRCSSTRQMMICFQIVFMAYNLTWLFLINHKADGVRALVLFAP
jgi:hypothetical protein